MYGLKENCRALGKWTAICNRFSWIGVFKLQIACCTSCQIEGSKLLRLAPPVTSVKSLEFRLLSKTLCTSEIFSKTFSVSCPGFVKFSDAKEESEEYLNLPEWTSWIGITELSGLLWYLFVLARSIPGYASLLRVLLALNQCPQEDYREVGGKANKLFQGEARYWYTLKWNLSWWWFPSLVPQNSFQKFIDMYLSREHRQLQVN